MSKISSVTAQGYQTQTINQILKRQNDSLDILQNTSTGVRSKWPPPVSKSQQQETLQDKSFDIAAFLFRNFPNVTLTQRLSSTMRLSYENVESKTHQIDKTV
jgi:hypothetical protein